jgi:hypothetical protein
MEDMAWGHGLQDIALGDWIGMDKVKYLYGSSKIYEKELIGYKSMKNKYDLGTWKECRNSFDR